jgi:hypothetical protein
VFDIAGSPTAIGAYCQPVRHQQRRVHVLADTV